MSSIRALIFPSFSSLSFFFSSYSNALILFLSFIIPSSKLVIRIESYSELYWHLCYISQTFSSKFDFIFSSSSSSYFWKLSSMFGIKVSSKFCICFSIWVCVCSIYYVFVIKISTSFILRSK